MNNVLTVNFISFLCHNDLLIYELKWAEVLENKTDYADTDEPAHSLSLTTVSAWSRTVVSPYYLKQHLIISVITPFKSAHSLCLHFSQNVFTKNLA